MAPLLSVITVTKDNALGLAQTLSSVEGQFAIGEFELIVVDGASSDSTPLVVAAHQDLVTHFISEPDDGVYIAMNKGLRLATGQYIICLNAGDSLYGPSSGELLRRFLTPTSLEPSWLIFGAVHLAVASVPHRIRNLPHSWSRHVLGLQPHCHQACVFSASMVVALGSYDARYELVSDFDYIVRAGLMAKPIMINDVLVNYRGGGSSELAWRDIPRLLHRVRVDLFDLAGCLRLIDLAWSFLMEVRVQIFRSRMYRCVRPVLLGRRDGR